MQFWDLIIHAYQVCSLIEVSEYSKCYCLSVWCAYNQGGRTGFNNAHSENSFSENHFLCMAEQLYIFFAQHGNSKLLQGNAVAVYPSFAPSTALLTLLIRLLNATELSCLCVYVCLPLCLHIFPRCLWILRQEFEGERRLGRWSWHGRRVVEGSEEPVCGGRSSHPLLGSSQQGMEALSNPEISL